MNPIVNTRRDSTQSGVDGALSSCKYLCFQDRLFSSFQVVASSVRVLCHRRGIGAALSRSFSLKILSDGKSSGLPCRFFVLRRIRSSAALRIREDRTTERHALEKNYLWRSLRP